jgi:hypothetical protein
MEILFNAIGNPWKLKEPTGKFELFFSRCKMYWHFGSYESYEDLIKDLIKNFSEDDCICVFFPNGKTHDDPRFEPIIV